MEANHRNFKISYAVVFLLYFMFSIYYSRYIHSSFFPVFVGLILLGYALTFVLTGIPSLMRKFFKKKTYFLQSMLVGSILFFYLIVLNFLIRNVKIIEATYPEMDSIIGWNFNVLVWAIIIQAALYNHVGFFYSGIFVKLFRKLKGRGEYPYNDFNEYQNCYCDSEKNM